MSITKRVWIDRDPFYADVRAAYAREVDEHRSQFNVRLPTTRRAVHSATGWDTLWPSGLIEAAKELNIEYVLINWGMFFCTREDAGVYPC
jgi:hypothetical protein